MVKSELANVEVSCREFGDYCVSCRSTGKRYHMWVNRENRRDVGELYKRSLAGLGERGYYACKLPTYSAFARKLIRQMLDAAEAGRLFDKAEAKMRAELQGQAPQPPVASSKPPVSSHLDTVTLSGRAG